MKVHTEVECRTCVHCRPMPKCEQCHDELLARYCGSQAALAEALGELREIREEVDNLRLRQDWRSGL